MSTHPLEATAIARIITARRHPPEKGWVCVEEITVPDTRRRGRDRRLDLLAISNKGRVAYEIKISRADWLRELDDPHKAEAAQAIAHACWFAAPPGLIPVEELPEGWGLLEVTKGGRTRRKRAAATSVPGPLSDAVISRCLRRALRTKVDEHGRQLRAPVEAWTWGDQALTEEQLVVVAQAQFHSTVEQAVERSLRDKRYDVSLAVADALQGHQDAEHTLQELRRALGLPPGCKGAEVLRALGAERYSGVLAVRERALEDLRRIHRRLGGLVEREEVTDGQ